MGNGLCCCGKKPQKKYEIKVETKPETNLTQS